MRPRKIEVSDAAKRLYETYTLHRLADPIGHIGKWFAVKLSDADSDRTLYPSKAEAVRYQKGDERMYAYVQIVPAQMSPQDAEVFLSTYRKIYDAGLRLVDRDHRAGGIDLIKRTSREDQRATVQAALRQGKPSNLIIGKDIY